MKIEEFFLRMAGRAARRQLQTLDTVLVGPHDGEVSDSSEASDSSGASVGLVWWMMMVLS